MGAYIDPAWWREAAIAEPLRQRDVAAIFRVLKKHGWSNTRIAAVTGLGTPRVGDILAGRHLVQTYPVLERIADGLGIERGLMGLAYTANEMVTQSSPSEEGAVQVDPAAAALTEDRAWGLSWGADVSSTLHVVTGMWRADMDRRNFLVSAGFAGGGFAGPARDWLLGWPDAEVGTTGTGRKVGQTDVDMLWMSCQSFQEMDRRMGGGYARGSLVHFLNNVVTPLLRGDYTEEVGRQLLAVAARLTDIAGYSAYDAHEQGLAQRYYIQALRMARSADNDALGAHIFGDMTRQSYYIGELDEAVSLARAGQQAAQRANSWFGVARCASLEARALAMQGDKKASEAAMTRAERAMTRANPDEEPVWIKYFSTDQLEAEFAHAAEALGRPKEVLRFAEPALAADRPLERRNVLVGTTAARAHAANGDIEKAAHLGIQVLDMISGMSSERALDAAKLLRADLAPYSRGVAAGFAAKARELLPV
jgi:hypothetical protein